MLANVNVDVSIHIAPLSVTYSAAAAAVAACGTIIISVKPLPLPLSTSRPPLMQWLRWYRANKNVLSRSLKAASVGFGLQTGSGSLFQKDGPVMTKSHAAIRVDSVTRYLLQISLNWTKMSLAGRWDAVNGEVLRCPAMVQMLVWTSQWIWLAIKPGRIPAFEDKGLPFFFPAHSEQNVPIKMRHGNEVHNLRNSRKIK